MSAKTSHTFDVVRKITQQKTITTGSKHAFYAYVVIVWVILFKNCIKNNLDSVKYRSRSKQQVCPTCHVTAFHLPSKYHKTFRSYNSFDVIDQNLAEETVTSAMTLKDFKTIICYKIYRPKITSVVTSQFS